MKIDFRNYLEGQIVIIIIPGKKYPTTLKKVVAQVASKSRKVCYVSLNKPVDALANGFEGAGIDNGKFIFIDCMGKTKARKDIQSFSVSSPDALTEISININKSFAANADCIVIDSLSTILLRGNPLTAIKFAHLLVSKCRILERKCVFMCLEEDMEGDFKRNLSALGDKIIYTEKLNLNR